MGVDNKGKYSNHVFMFGRNNILLLEIDPSPPYLRLGPYICLLGVWFDQLHRIKDLTIRLRDVGQCP